MKDLCDDILHRDPESLSEIINACAHLQRHYRIRGREHHGRKALPVSSDSPQQQVSHVHEAERPASGRMHRAHAVSGIRHDKATDHVITPEHAAIRDAVLGNASVIVRAAAGSGKTTVTLDVIRAIMKRNPKERILYLAFTKSVADAFQKKVPPGVHVSTIHAWCLKHLQSDPHRRFMIDENKIRVTATEFIRAKRQEGPSLPRGARKSYDAWSTYINDLQSLWEMAAGTLTPMHDQTALQAMAITHGLSVSSQSKAFDWLASFHERVMAKIPQVSMPEILMRSVQSSHPRPSYDRIFIDEAQDLSNAQIQAIQQIPCSQIVAVGDPCQAIYAFNGANGHALQTIGEGLQIPERDWKPLSMSWRCSKAVVAAAAPYAPPGFSARPDAVDGSVIKVPADRLNQTIASLQPGDYGICRVNAPLVGLALLLNKQGKKVAILGENIQENLLDMVRKSDKTLLPHIIADQVVDQATRDAEAMVRDGADIAAETILDRATVLHRILSISRDYDHAMEIIQRFFTRTLDPDGITLSSIHRAKGLEADRVIIFGHNHIPHPSIADSSSALLKMQERNLLYVGMTRAKKDLVLQEVSNDWIKGPNGR
jgi:hypothetical protein